MSAPKMTVEEQTAACLEEVRKVLSSWACRIEGQVLIQGKVMSTNWIVVAIPPEEKG